MSNLPNGCTAQEIDNLCAEPGPETLSCATCGNTFHEMDTDAYRTDAGAHYCYSEQGDCWFQHQKLGFKTALTAEILPQIHALREQMYRVAAEYGQDDSDSVAAMIAFDDHVREEAEGARSTFRSGVTLPIYDYSVIESELTVLSVRLQVERGFVEREDGPDSYSARFATQDCVRIGRVLQLLENAYEFSVGRPDKWEYMPRPWQRQPRIAPKAETVAPVLEVSHG